MSAAGRERSDPIATLTLFRDVPDEERRVDLKQAKAALSALFPESDFRLEHRGLVVDGRSQVVFEVYNREEPSAARLTDPPRPEKRWTL